MCVCVCRLSNKFIYTCILKKEHYYWILLISKYIHSISLQISYDTNSLENFHNILQSVILKKNKRYYIIFLTSFCYNKNYYIIALIVKSRVKPTTRNTNSSTSIFQYLKQNGRLSPSFKSFASLYGRKIFWT